MKRRKLETSETTAKRGAKEGDVRNPEGRGGFKPGQSGNPAGRPLGSVTKVPQIENIWDCWRKSNALGWLYCSLNFKLPISLFADPENLSKDEVREIRSLLVKNYWRGMDFIRKTCQAKLEELEMGEEPIGLHEMMVEREARANRKLIDIDERTRKQAQA